MAVADLELSARRTAILLRCQRVRERHRHADVLRAERAGAEAAEVARHAGDLAKAADAASSQRLRQAYEALSGRVVGASELADLPRLQALLAREASELAAGVEAAEDAVRAAAAAAAAARAALLTEARTTETRGRMAERARIAWRRAADVAEELERDDQVADTWRPT